MIDKEKACTACSGSGHYCSGKCGACNGTGLEYTKDDIIKALEDKIKEYEKVIFGDIWPDVKTRMEQKQDTVHTDLEGERREEEK